MKLFQTSIEIVRACQESFVFFWFWSSQCFA